MIEVLILAFALSMDAFAVSIGLGIKNKQDIKTLTYKSSFIVAFIKRVLGYFAS